MEEQNTKKRTGRHYIDLTGKKFNRLTVLRLDPKRTQSGATRWQCRCDCGTIKTIRSRDLVANTTKRCGCLLSEMARQKMRRTGADSAAWKGGRHITPHGYVCLARRIALKLYPHCNASSKGINEHIAVMSQHLGRPLQDGETIHHKNGIRTDNRIENLELWLKAQPSGQRIEDMVEHWTRMLQRYAPERLVLSSK